MVRSLKSEIRSLKSEVWSLKIPTESERYLQTSDALLYTVKVLLFIGTNYRGFYKHNWQTINRNILLRWIFIFFRGLCGTRNQRKLEPHD